MKNSNYLLGVLPNSLNFSHPQDRRRYLPFLINNNINYEIAEFNKIYDCLYISLNCDLNLWAKYKSRENYKKTKIVFDLSDNYLVDGYFRSCIRSILHFITGKTRSLKFNYRKTIINVLNIADIVTVGSVEQKDFIENYTNGRVVIVRDYFEEFNDLKLLNNTNDIDVNNIHILWEGFSHSLIHIIKIVKQILLEITNREKFFITLHFVTDCKICRIMGRFLCIETTNYLIKNIVFNRVKINYHQWSINNLYNISKICRLAIIPIPKNNFMMSKPENKILLYWHLKLPVLTSNIPSYYRVFSESGNSKYICSDIKAWASNIETLIYNDQEYIQYLKNSSDYYNKYNSVELYNLTWNSIFFE